MSGKALVTHIEWAEAYQREQDYWERYWRGVLEETVYNRVFRFLPLRPYRLRRRVARWITRKLTDE